MCQARDGEKLRRSCALWLAPIGRGAGLLLLPLALAACAVSSLSNPFRSSEATSSPIPSDPNGPLPELPRDGQAIRPPAVPVAGAPAAPMDPNDVSLHCPQVVSWPHDRLMTIYANGQAGDAGAVVHRGEITRMARECQIYGDRVTVKYGFAGRVMLGPKGRPGQVTLPYNVKVANTERQVLAADAGSISTMVPQDNPIGYFSVVKEISFPVSVGTRPQDYKVFVAFGAKQG